jgi:hypothetical protein
MRGLESGCPSMMDPIACEPECRHQWVVIEWLAPLAQEVLDCDRPIEGLEEWQEGVSS